jgi:Rps23 Pro-64 3,4-dihydroxylase Tpa1-like proline 4-hydroxylase
MIGMWNNMPEHVTNLLNFLNSREVLKFLEELTGIPDLIADPEFYGGGVHRILPGGKLSVHADYNFHPITKLHRRVNLLLYLNKNWEEEWGGDLQLWNKDMSMCVKKILPIFNRAVIFNITSDAYHGHPGSLKSPEGVDRLSFALYYFTKTRPENEITEPHMAVWKEV